MALLKTAEIRNSSCLKTAEIPILQLKTLSNPLFISIFAYNKNDIYIYGYFI